MADPAKYKSLSVPREDWEQLGVLATKTNRTRSKMIGRLIRFFLDNKGVKKNGKDKIANHRYICPECKGNGYNKVYDMIVQCDKCKSEGELPLEEPTLEELQAMAASARLQ